jgi:hypothetical protein
MKKQNRQIIILFNVVSQLVSLKLKRKLIVMFSNEDLTFTDSQRVSSKRIVKLTKQTQIIRIETIRIKKAKIHEKSIEFLISLIFETKHFESKSALFVNKHVFFQSNRFDSFINVLSFTNLTSRIKIFLNRSSSSCSTSFTILSLFLSQHSFSSSKSSSIQRIYDCHATCF